MKGAAEVAVVGAGITGLSIAFRLAERDVRVTVYERTGVASGASGVQPGGVRLQWGTEVNCRLVLESLPFHRSAQERLEMRVDPGFRACGYLFLAHSAAALARLEANVALQHRLGVPSRIVTPAEAAELVPGLGAKTIAGGSWCGEDGYFDRPQAVVEAVAEAAARAGVTIEHDAVESLEPVAGAWRLQLAAGGERAAEQVVVAAGWETPALLAPLGVEVPIQREERYLFLSEPIRERLLEPLVISAERRFAAKHLANGRVLASDFGARGDPAEGEPRWRAHVRDTIQELVPALTYVSFPHLVAGLYDVTPDHQAILGAVPGHNGLWLAAGFSGHGFMIAPAVGRLLADAITGEGEGEELRVLSLERFARGELVPEPAVI